MRPERALRVASDRRRPAREGAAAEFLAVVGRRRPLPPAAGRLLPATLELVRQVQEAPRGVEAERLRVGRVAGGRSPAGFAGRSGGERPAQGSSKRLGVER